MKSALTLVLLPGMDGTGILFDPFIAALGQRYTISVVRYPPRHAANYGELAGIVRRALPAEGDFVVLGESFSGPLAVTIAASRPRGLVGLVLCCSFVRNPRPALKPFDRLVGAMPVAPAAVMSYFLFGRHATAQRRALLVSAVSSVSAPVLRARLRDVIKVDVSEELKQVRVPVLYLQAAEDKLVPGAAARVITGLAPATEVVALDAPHCLLQAVPEEAALVVTATVERWLHQAG